MGFPSIKPKTIARHQTQETPECRARWMLDERIFHRDCAVTHTFPNLGCFSSARMRRNFKTMSTVTRTLGTIPVSIGNIGDIILMKCPLTCYKGRCLGPRWALRGPWWMWRCHNQRDSSAACSHSTPKSVCRHDQWPLLHSSTAIQPFVHLLLQGHLFSMHISLLSVTCLLSIAICAVEGLCVPCAFQSILKK